MKITITIEDMPDGTTNVSFDSDPPLIREDTHVTPAYVLASVAFKAINKEIAASHVDHDEHTTAEL